jgi:hypothetical protein
LFTEKKIQTGRKRRRRRRRRRRFVGPRPVATSKNPALGQIFLEGEGQTAPGVADKNKLTINVHYLMIEPHIMIELLPMNGTIGKYFEIHAFYVLLFHNRLSRLLAKY